MFLSFSVVPLIQARVSSTVQTTIGGSKSTLQKSSLIQFSSIAKWWSAWITKKNAILYYATQRNPFAQVLIITKKIGSKKFFKPLANSVFRTLSNIYVGGFCRTLQNLVEPCRTVHLRCLKGLWIHLCRPLEIIILR